MVIRNILAICIAVIVLSACNSGNSNKPTSTGRGSEIVVVCDKALWDKTVSEPIKKALTREMDGLPESEPEFTLINVPQKSFSRFLQSHHNVIVVEIIPDAKKAKVETLQDVWAYPQRVVKIIIPSDTAFLNLFEKHANGIRELFNQSERIRYRTINGANRNTKIEKQLADEFGIKMEISKDYYLAKKTKDFVWLRYETNVNSLALLIYTYPYTDTAQLSPQQIYDARNKYTKNYIPGPSNGSYMTLEIENFKPSSNQIQFKNLYAVETRGLWKTFGDFMGGPFINYTIVDAPRQRIVVFDGYVYYPNKDKRNFIKQLESLIWNAEFVNPSKQSDTIK